MAATVKVIGRRKVGTAFMVIADIQMDNSYATGGEPVTPAAFGLSALDFVLPSPAAGYLFEFDHTNKKLKAFTPMPQHTHDLLLTGGQAAGDALQQLAGVVGKTAAANVTALGGASNIQNRAAAVAGEVANATDLSAVKVRVIAIGL